MKEYTFYIGNFEGMSLYKSVPENEINEMLKFGFTWGEIEQYHSLTDWQQDC